MNEVSEEEMLAFSVTGIRLQKRLKLKAVPRIVYFTESGEIWMRGKKRNENAIELIVNTTQKAIDGKLKGKEVTGTQFYLAISYKNAKKLAEEITNFLKKHKKTSKASREV